MKPKERYHLQRDCILGSSVWGRMSETIIYIQNLNPEDPASNRELWLLPRNGISERFVFGFKDGILVEVDVQEETSDAGLELLGWIENHFKPGQEFTRADLKGIIGSRATLTRSLRKLVELGVLLHATDKLGMEKRGVYQVADPSLGESV